VEDYKRRQLDDPANAAGGEKGPDGPASAGGGAVAAEPNGRSRDTRRKYLRAYLGYLWPHRYAVGAVFLLALVVAGMEMIEPLFMRFIVDRVLLNTGLDSTSRLTHLHLVGAAFLAAVLFSKSVGVLKDYRMRLLNVRVMLALRRSLFDRLLHL